MSQTSQTLCRIVPTCKAVELDGGVEGPELLLERVDSLDEPPQFGLGSVGWLSLGDSHNIP